MFLIYLFLGKAVGILSRNRRKRFCGFQKLRPTSHPQNRNVVVVGNPQPQCGLVRGKLTAADVEK
uniref:Uncharacterized protein n=1 Tax=Romanomermis culicivorax TaxID=13658 RepID=A0A915I0U2_ROMCU